jgi:hypothetical protein
MWFCFSLVKPSAEVISSVINMSDLFKGGTEFGFNWGFGYYVAE